MQHGMVLAQDHGVHGGPGFGREFLEAAAFELVRDEGGALLGRQFVEGGLDLVEQDRADVGGFRAGFGRGQQVFEAQRLAVFGAQRRGRRKARAASCGRSP